ncbi:hypothetical protein COP2_010868 [Malus domestica]
MASFDAFSVDGDDLHASDIQFDQDDVVVESYADYGPAAAPDSLDVFRFDGSGFNYSHSTPFDSVPVENGNGNGYGVGENDIDRTSELLQLLNDVVGTSKFGGGVTGHLFFHLYRQGIFSEDQARFYTAEIVSAIAHLHKCGIVYRDLKPENVLVDSDGHAMLTDFGLAKEIDEASRSNSMCGTTEYMAPEILLSKGHNKDADW